MVSVRFSKVVFFSLFVLAFYADNTCCASEVPPGVEIVRLPEKTVLFTESSANLNREKGSGWAKLSAFFNNVLNCSLDSFDRIGVWQENPLTTLPKDAGYDTCVAIDIDLEKKDQGVQKGTLPGGLYLAMFSCVGLFDTYRTLLDCVKSTEGIRRRQAPCLNIMKARDGRIVAYVPVERVGSE